MNLLVDVGNTRIKWAEARGREVVEARAAVHAGKPLSALLAEEWRALPAPARILIANVAGEPAAEDLRSYCRAHFGLQPEFLVPGRSACGITNGYHDPAQLGADRWAGVIGACIRHVRPVCVIACGTAITVDTVTRTGRHLGGLIAPGLGVMQSALAAAAPALHVAPDEAVELYATNTRSAVASGVLYAVSGFAQRALREVRDDQGEALSVLLTGGDAERLRPYLPGAITMAPHLVLEGLAVLAEAAS